MKCIQKRDACEKCTTGSYAKHISYCYREYTECRHGAITIQRKKTVKPKNLLTSGPIKHRDSRKLHISSYCSQFWQRRKGRKLISVPVYCEPGTILGILHTLPSLCGERCWALNIPFLLMGKRAQRSQVVAHNSAANQCWVGLSDASHSDNGLNSYVLSQIRGRLTYNQSLRIPRPQQLLAEGMEEEPLR